MGVYGTLVSDTAIYLFSTLYVEYLINKNPNSLTTRDWCSSTGMWKWGDSKQLSVGWSGPPGRLQLGGNGKLMLALWTRDQLLEGAEEG